MIDATFLDRLAGLVGEAQAKILEVDGRKYSTQRLVDAELEIPVAKPVELHTLTGFLDFARHALDAGQFRAGTEKPPMIVVEASRVALVGVLEGHHRQREALAIATPVGTCPAVVFGNWMDLESAIIRLQTFFADDGDRAKVLQLIGSVTNEAVRTIKDDGITQGVTVKAGIVLVGQQAVPNPVNLAPFRSFPEIRPVTSRFVLRLRGGGDGEPPVVALFDVEGQRWMVETAAQIVGWLRTELGQERRLQIIG